MLPYYALMFIPLVFAFLYEYIYEEKLKNYNFKKKNYTIIVFFVIYFLLLALRSENVGVDLHRYVDVYDEIKDLSFSQVFAIYGSSDIGYYLMNKIISLFGFNSRFFIIFVAFITSIPLAYMYYKESKNSLVSISLFLVIPVFQMLFSGLRQSIAIALVVPCYYFVKDKKIIKYVITVFIAFLFHKSALILLIMYPIYYWKINAKHLILIFPLGLLFYRYNNQILMIGLNILGSKFVEKYASFTSTGAYTFLMVFIAFVIYSFIFIKEKDLAFEENHNRNFLILMTFLQMFAPINTIAMRVNYYFMIFIPVIIPQTTMKLKIKDKNIKLIAFTAIYLMFTLYFLDKMGTTDSLNIYPYEVFWDNYSL